MASKGSPETKLFFYSILCFYVARKQNCQIPIEKIQNHQTVILTDKRMNCLREEAERNELV